MQGFIVHPVTVTYTLIIVKEDDDDTWYNKFNINDFKFDRSIKSFIRFKTENEKNDCLYIRKYQKFRRTKFRIKWGTDDESQDIRMDRWRDLYNVMNEYHSDFINKSKQCVALNKMFKKRRRRENARNKYLKCLAMLSNPLPNEIDNIIVSFCI
jgi:hypothetical protein